MIVFVCVLSARACRYCPFSRYCLFKIFSPCLFVFVSLSLCIYLLRLQSKAPRMNSHGANERQVVAHRLRNPLLTPSLLSRSPPPSARWVSTSSRRQQAQESEETVDTACKGTTWWSLGSASPVQTTFKAVWSQAYSWIRQNVFRVWPPCSLELLSNED